MSDKTGGLRCTFTCWTVGGLAGLVAVAMMLVIGDMSWPGSIFTGAVLAVGVGLLLSLTLCRDLPTMQEARARHAVSAPARATGTTSAAPTAKAAAAPATPTAETRAAMDPAPEPHPAHEGAGDPPPTAAPVSNGLDTPAAKPEMMSAPREGGPDNLKEIKGVGPKLEELLHSMGVYHFDQIAGWGPSEVAWMDDHLEGFKGRVSRDDWVSQAKILSAGGETEFSTRVDKGDIY